MPVKKVPKKNAKRNKSRTKKVTKAGESFQHLFNNVKDFLFRNLLLFIIFKVLFKLFLIILL